MPSMPPIWITTAGIAKLLDNPELHKAAGRDSLSPMVQDDLDALQKWETTWRMEVNDTKCEVLWFRGLWPQSNILINCMALD